MLCYVQPYVGDRQCYARCNKTLCTLTDGRVIAFGPLWFCLLASRKPQQMDRDETLTISRLRRLMSTELEDVMKLVYLRASRCYYVHADGLGMCSDNQQYSNPRNSSELSCVALTISWISLAIVPDATSKHTARITDIAQGGPQLHYSQDLSAGAPVAGEGAGVEDGEVGRPELRQVLLRRPDQHVVHEHAVVRPRAHHPDLAPRLHANTRVWVHTKLARVRS